MIPPTDCWILSHLIQTVSRILSCCPYVCIDMMVKIILKNEFPSHGRYTFNWKIIYFKKNSKTITQILTVSARRILISELQASATGSCTFPDPQFCPCGAHHRWYISFKRWSHPAVGMVLMAAKTCVNRCEACLCLIQITYITCLPMHRHFGKISLKWSDKRCWINNVWHISLCFYKRYESDLSHMLYIGVNVIWTGLIMHRWASHRLADGSMGSFLIIVHFLKYTIWWFWPFDQITEE